MRKAFSLIELIIVIVVIGILAANMMPNIKANKRAEAMNQILTMIRYTQNLALNDNKHLRDEPKWQRGFWSFRVYKCSGEEKYYFRIGSDETLNGSLEKTETAVDPSNGKYLYGHSNVGSGCDLAKKQADVSPNVFLDKFGINKVEFSSCSGNLGSGSAKHIGFDRFGRVYKNFGSSSEPEYKSYRKTKCRIKFSFADSNPPFTVRVKTETGFAYVEEKPDL